MNNITDTINLLLINEDDWEQNIPLPLLRLQRTHTAYCPRCNTRTSTNDSNNRQVYCIDCLTHTSVILQRLIKKKAQESYLKYRKTLLVIR